MPSFRFAPLNDIQAFDQVINDDTTAVLVESIQGEGGIYEAEDSFLQELSNICAEQKVMLLLDEVQAESDEPENFLVSRNLAYSPVPWPWPRGSVAAFLSVPSGSVSPMRKHLVRAVMALHLGALPSPALLPMRCLMY